MSYTFRAGGKGVDVITTTRKGEAYGGLPKGVIIPIGVMHVENFYRQVTELVKAERLNVYVAKHCDRENEVTHIVPYGTVNRFGIFLTRETVPGTDWCLDIGPGEWLRCRTVGSIAEIRDLI